MGWQGDHYRARDLAPAFPSSIDGHWRFVNAASR
jgi:hypothetical protein